MVAGGILGRAVFDLTGGEVNAMLPGAIELAALALMATVLAAIPAAADAGLVQVDLLSGRLPAGLRAALARLWLGLLAAVAVLLLRHFALEAAAAAARGDVTQDLRLPMAWLHALAATEFAALALIAAAEALAPGATRPRALR